MSDSERLNLIEHYKWDVLHRNRLGYWITGSFGHTDYYKTLREAIDAALASQAKWSIGK